MKRGAALLLCLVLLGALALSAGAEGQKLLYPGVTIQGDDVYCLGIPMTGGTIQATANGQEIDVLPTTLPETNLGVTYYCVVSVTSSLSNIQREQQRRRQREQQQQQQKRRTPRSKRRSALSAPERSGP